MAPNYRSWRSLHLHALVMAIVAVLIGSCCAVDIARVITNDIFDRFLSQKDSTTDETGSSCDSMGFYTRKAFIKAARFGKWNGEFGANMHELAAFFAHVAHETGKGCHVREAGQERTAYGNYYGRGPLQLTHQSNYEGAGHSIGVDLVDHPGLAATDRVVSFETAIWFWMTQSPQAAPGDNPHQCMLNYNFGCTTRAITGSAECNHGDKARSRVQYYLQFCQDLGINPTDHLYC